MTGADGRLRAAIGRFQGVLALAQTSKATVAAVNTTYGTTYPQATPFVAAVLDSSIGALLADALAAFTLTPATPAVVPVPTANGGALLPGRAAFGEYEDPSVVVAPPVVVPPPVAAVPAPVAEPVTLAGPSGTVAGVTIESAPGVSLDFVPLASGSSTPLTMYLYVYVDDPITATVTFADRYVGQPFTVHLADGRTATGTFTEGTLAIWV